LSDLVITEVIAALYEPDEHGRRKPESLYGSLKMSAHLQRQGITVARCTVERIMRANGWVGVTRAKHVRTTISDPAADRAPDLVKRQFGAKRPNELFVADFTYVPMDTGVFAYTAFVIDAYAGTIVGWECSSSKITAFVERAIRQAASTRRREGNPLPGTIHHSDAGSQYTAVHFGETLALEGLRPSIGTVGDAFDNALAETHHRAVQNRMHPARITVQGRPIRPAQQHRGRHQRLGALVQHRQAHAPPRTPTTPGARSRLLRSSQ
jgi:transposase InsO family protein